MNLYCSTCQKETSHTDFISFGYVAPGIVVCKKCSARNYHPTLRENSLKFVYYLKPQPTVDEAIRLYRQRGVKHPERLFPEWKGESRITLDAFLTQMRAREYQLFKITQTTMIEWHCNALYGRSFYGQENTETHIGHLLISAKGMPSPGYIRVELTEDIDSAYIASLVPGNKMITGYIAMQR